MINYSSRTKYFISLVPTDMRKGYEGLAAIVRKQMEHNPLRYNEVFILYSKDYRKVKVLHYDINGWVLYSKWFTEGRFLKLRFEECKKSYGMTCEILILLLSTSVQTNIRL